MIAVLIILVGAFFQGSAANLFRSRSACAFAWSGRGIKTAKKWQYQEAGVRRLRSEWHPRYQMAREEVSDASATRIVGLPGGDQKIDKALLSELNDPDLARTVRRDLEKAAYTETAEKWYHNLDYDAFGAEVTALGKRLKQDCGEMDNMKHLRKILRWRDAAMVIGVLSMALPPNPLTVVALSTWTYASWTMVAHHTCHGGYNRAPNAGKYKSKKFGAGSTFRRLADWGDWMLPEAWNVEHNRLHHYRLGEPADPDLVEQNLQFLRDDPMPMTAKYLYVAMLVPIWKWLYYSPNTFKELKLAQMRSEKQELPEGLQPERALTLKRMVFPENEAEQIMANLITPGEYFRKVFAPFAVTRFFLLPAPLLFIQGGVGPVLFGHAIINLILAELLTNIHSFITIVTNHAGEDLYKFDDSVRPKSGAFYVRQVISSTNYNYGNDALDFCHGWLNYQIEHHVWPDLSMLQYQRGAPLLREICDRHNVPYVQENVWIRTRKTIDVMVGKTSMIQFPTKVEPAKDKAGASGITWKSTHGAIDED